MELDLTEAVDAAAKATYEAQRKAALARHPEAAWHGWAEVDPINKLHWRENVLQAVQAAAEVLASQAVDHVRVRLLEAAELLPDHPDIKQQYLIAYDLVAEVTE